MTNKEAIEVLNYSYGYEFSDRVTEALDLAIKALEAQDLTKNNQDSNQGDLISREALKRHRFLTPDAVEATRLLPAETKAYQQGWNDAIDAIIDNAPTVVRPKGEWIGEKNLIRCNQCMAEYHYSWLIGNEPDLPNYCPECGADMRGEENER